MLPLDPSDTIAAVASPAGVGWRGIVRLSGPQAIEIALEGFTPDDDRAVGVPARPERRPGRVRVNGLRPLVPASLILWPGVRTYTRQPIAEIHTVGAAPVVQQVLADCMALGARLAEPGEFTLRAFLAGRIDLTQAEAVLGVIDARHPAQLDAALDQLAGGLGGPIAALRDQLLDVLAHLEANLDFMDEPDVDELGRLELAETLAAGARIVSDLAARMSDRDRHEGHPLVVLVGPPNAGKSRLFNALLGRAQALVSPQPGTTRDYLSALCDCDGLAVELVDTAGIEDAVSPIDARAQSLRNAQAARADLLLDCRPSDGEPDAPAFPFDRPSLRVRTKCDLDAANLPDAIPTSAATGDGLAALRSAIAQSLRDQSTADPLAASTGARCRDALARAGASLASAAETLALDGGDELVAVDLRQALDDLGKVVGAVVTDDILDRIFRRFCIGK